MGEAHSKAPLGDGISIESSSNRAVAERRVKLRTVFWRVQFFRFGCIEAPAARLDEARFDRRWQVDSDKDSAVRGGDFPSSENRFFRWLQGFQNSCRRCGSAYRKLPGADLPVSKYCDVPAVSTLRCNVISVLIRHQCDGLWLRFVVPLRK